MEFEKALQILVDAGVEFVVIGGVSASFHGSARVTYDLDICYSRAPSNLRRLAAALAPFHPRPREFPADSPFVWDERTLQNGTVFIAETFIDPGRFRGTCYRAANWQLLGLTTGRGKNDQTNKPNCPIKEILGLPLTPRFREYLTQL